MPSFFVRDRAFFTQAKYCQLDRDILQTKVELIKSRRMRPKTCLANCIMYETMDLSCTIITDFMVISHSKFHESSMKCMKISVFKHDISMKQCMNEDHMKHH